MSLINIIGPATRDISVGEFASSGGTASVQNTTARNGGWALRTNPTTTAVGWAEIQALAADGTATPASVATSYLTFYFRFATSTAVEPICRVADTVFGGDVGNVPNKADLSITADKKLSLNPHSGSNNTGTTVLSAGTFYKINLKISTGSSGASYELKINDTVEFSGTGDLGASNAAAIRLGKAVNNASSTVDFFFQDFAWSNSAYPTGDRIDACIPNAAGTNQEFARSGTDSGSNWGQVDELPPDQVSWLATNTSGAKESELLDASVVTGENIACVKSWHYGRRNTTANTNACLVVLSNGTEVLTTARTYVGVWDFISILHELDPATGAAWTNAALDALEVGGKKVATSNAFKFDACGAMVYWTAATPSAAKSGLSIPAAILCS